MRPQHVRITEIGHPLCGHHATLKRPRRQDDGAWYSIDGALTAEERDFASRELPFPADDQNGRGQHVLLYPDQYREVGAEVVSITSKRDAEPDQKVMARAAHLMPEGRR